MVQEALGTLTVGLAESPTRQVSGARPESSTESIFAEVLADVMGVERVSVDSNFFDDLGCGFDGDGPVLCAGPEAA